MLDRPDKIQASEPGVDAIIKLAIFAVGGQGGGVLSSWIVDLARRNNYYVQSTSIAGVAQRTGATVYYLELLPKSVNLPLGQSPVFSLSPAPGDVDIVLAAELMEAGRAITRGLVTPDRTVLITSTHRTYATSEKSAPGNAIADAAEVIETAKNASADFIAFDMEAIALDAGTVISASLFGGLAGSGKLPFKQESFEETIKASGRGVESSIKAFRASLEAAGKLTDPGKASTEIIEKPEQTPVVPAKFSQQWQQLQTRIQSMPKEVHSIVQVGLRKVVDFQDLEYGTEYLQRVDQFLNVDREEFLLSATAAKYIANAMTYDDLIRVADIKTRKSRFNRIKKENGLTEDKILHIIEYFHPGGREFCSLLPAGIGGYVEGSPKLFGKIDWLVNRGRRVRTDTMFWFTMLYLVSGLRKYRRKLLRHNGELKHLQNLIEKTNAAIEHNYDLAIEIMKCQRLIKGYSDTHKRGISKFEKALTGIKLIEKREDAADWARRLREAALADVGGDRLDDAIKTVRSFSEE